MKDLFSPLQAGRDGLSHSVTIHRWRLLVTPALPYKAKDLELAPWKRGNSSSRDPLLDQVIAVPHVLIADEAEGVIDDATAGREIWIADVVGGSEPS